MGKFDMSGHRSRHRRSQPFIKNALQSELCVSLVPVYLDTHLEKPIRISDFSLQRTISTPHDDRFGRLGHDLKVVRYLRADIVSGGFEFGARPELVSCRRDVLVFLL